MSLAEIEVKLQNFYPNNYSILAKVWYSGAPPCCSAAKIFYYVVAHKVGPTLVATWQDPIASYST